MNEFRLQDLRVSLPNAIGANVDFTFTQLIMEMFEPRSVLVSDWLLFSAGLQHKNSPTDQSAPGGDQAALPQGRVRLTALHRNSLLFMLQSENPLQLFSTDSPSDSLTVPGF